jgi:putative spermidine/putrescine transport system substrate-binding protein
MLKSLLATTVLMASATVSLADDLSTMSWDDIVAQAKQEGELTWYVWYLRDDFRRAVQSFEKEFGISVTIPEGPADGNSEKMLAERDRETGDIDVLAWGYDGFETVELGPLFTPLSMLPADAGRVVELAGFDGGDHVVAFWGNQTGIAYDPAHVSADNLPQTPGDFAAFWTENPGKFGFNYEKGGSGPSYYQNTLRVVADVDFSVGEVSKERLASLQPGIDFFNEHAENYVVTASNADSIVRVSDGELWMVPAWEDHLAGLQNRGEVRKEIKFYIPEMGMNGGGNGVAIPLNAPNPAAAAVFVNWLTSPETQSMFNKDFGTAPMNAAADDSFALVPNEQRAFRTTWGAQPFRGEVEASFIDNVILER